MSECWDSLYALDDQVEKFLDGNIDREAIMKEAADVANFALIVADICLASTGEE